MVGASTGCFAQVIASPFDVAKIRMQASREQKGSFRSELLLIGQEGGLAGYFRGMEASLLRAVIQYGCTIGTYDSSKARLVDSYGLKDGVTTHVAASMLSGVVTALLGTPADVMKTRMIAQHYGGADPIYRNSLDCVRQTVRREGLAALWKGLTPTYLRLAPWHTIFFVAYEQACIAVTGQPMPTR